jgi:hypothetical protein
MKAFRKHENKAKAEREERRKKKQAQEDQDKARKEKLKQQKEQEEKLREEALNRNQSATLTELTDEEAAKLQSEIEQVGLNSFCISLS